MNFDDQLVLEQLVTLRHHHCDWMDMDSFPQIATIWFLLILNCMIQFWYIQIHQCHHQDTICTITLRTSFQEVKSLMAMVTGMYQIQVLELERLEKEEGKEDQGSENLYQLKVTTVLNKEQMDRQVTIIAIHQLIHHSLDQQINLLDQTIHQLEEQFTHWIQVQVVATVSMQQIFLVWTFFSSSPLILFSFTFLILFSFTFLILFSFTFLILFAFLILFSFASPLLCVVSNVDFFPTYMKQSWLTVTGNRRSKEQVPVWKREGKNHRWRGRENRKREKRKIRWKEKNREKRKIEKKRGR